jgi:hypothetical protein
LGSLQNSAQVIADAIAGKMGQGAVQQALQGLNNKQGQNNLDPLGRVSPSGKVKKGEFALDELGIERKQTETVMQELLNRLNDPDRSADEKAYIQRLLDKF